MNDSTTLDPPTTALEGDTRSMPTFNNDYGPADLVSRRRALGVTGRDLAALIGRAQGNYAKSEQGNRRASDQLVEQIREIEAWALKHYDNVLASARDYIQEHPGEPVQLRQLTEAGFHRAHRSARTEHAVFPVSIHETVVGRVAADLEREGYIVTIKVVAR